MKITVAICTWNRADLLRETLCAMTQLHIPDGTSWELLVVNNRCTDNTDEVIGEYAGRLPLRRLFEEKQGLSHARNCAVAAATGDLLIWTDDDVLPDPGWLAAYKDAAERWPDAVYFGGTIDPEYRGTPPRWILDNPELVEGPYAIRRLGVDVRPLGPTEYPFGANMGFRTKCLGAMSFDPRLGRIGSGMLSGDETALVRDLKAKGFLGLWVGPARVRHIIPVERQTKAYVAKFQVGLGATSVREFGVPEGRRFLGVPSWAIREYLLTRAKAFLRSRKADPAWSKAFSRSAYLKGVIRAARQARHQAPARAIPTAQPLLQR